MASVERQDWGTVSGGQVHRYLLSNAAGNTVAILNYGGIVQSIHIDGAEVVIGYDELDGYLGEQPFYGAIVGRYANRIGGASFKLGGQTYRLDANEGKNQLHGGSEGFNTKLWAAEPSTEGAAAVLRLRRLSPDGEMGYPGNLDVTVTYTWDDANALRIDYHATTDRDTVVNLTSHCYFNIGDDADVLDHILQVDADRYTPVGPDQIPTGELPSVNGTPFDLRSPRRIGEAIADGHPQMKAAGGFDHNLAVSSHTGKLREVALVMDPRSGRKLRCLTTEPGVQVFTTNFPTGQFTGRGNAPLPRHAAVCLETQHFPDAPNQPDFPSTVLKAGETFNSTTVFRFE